VTRAGAVTGLDYPALRDDLLNRLRGDMARNATLAAALPDLERAVQSHFEPPCC
jgi:hypothetical protein